MRPDKTDDAQVDIDGGYVRGRPNNERARWFRQEHLGLCGTKKENRSCREGALPGFRPMTRNQSTVFFELLKRQGMQPNQQVDFLSDGSEDVRNLQLSLNPQAKHLLDRFHLTMGLTVLSQTAKGLPERLGEEEDKYELRSGVLYDLERIKWYLWHGNVFQALNELQSLGIALDAAAFESKSEHSQKLLKALRNYTPTSSATRSSYQTTGSAIETRNGALPISSSRRSIRS
jgi:hypothetical protein